MFEAAFRIALKGQSHNLSEYRCATASSQRTSHCPRGLRAKPTARRKPGSMRRKYL
jgi:hypothetical protein